MIKYRLTFNSKLQTAEIQALWRSWLPTERMLATKECNFGPWANGTLSPLPPESFSLLPNYLPIYFFFLLPSQVPWNFGTWTSGRAGTPSETQSRLRSQREELGGWTLSQPSQPFIAAKHKGTALSFRALSVPALCLLAFYKCLCGIAK